jgi:hypothetical protein
VKLLNVNAAASDSFGTAVGISGDYVIVGAPADTENGFTNTGSATIFNRNVNTNAWE